MHACVSRWSWWVSVRKVFFLFSTDARRACSHGVIGSAMGVYPRCTGSNPVERNGPSFFMPSALSFIFLSRASSDSVEVLADREVADGSRGPTDRTWSVLYCMLVFHDGVGG